MTIDQMIEELEYIGSLRKEDALSWPRIMIFSELFCPLIIEKLRDWERLNNRVLREMQAKYEFHN